MHEQPVVQPEDRINNLAADAMPRDKLPGQTAEQVRKEFSAGKTGQELGSFSSIALIFSNQMLHVPASGNDRLDSILVPVS
jgi:hypothetical protein